MQALNKSTGSALSLVRPSATMRFVGSHLIEPFVFLRDSLIITTSMLVRLSSIEVGDDGEMRWSNNDLQSVANIGDLRLSMDLA